MQRRPLTLTERPWAYFSRWARAYFQHFGQTDDDFGTSSGHCVAECCGSALYTKENDEVALKHHHSEDYEGSYTLSGGTKSFGGAWRGDNRRMMFAALPKDEFLKVAYSEAFQTTHPVQSLQLDDPDIGCLTICWVDE